MLSQRTIKRSCVLAVLFVAAFFCRDVSLSLAGQSETFFGNKSVQPLSQENPRPVIDQEIKDHVPDAQLVGQGRLSVFIWDVYDSFLYAPAGKWQPDQPFALKLIYLRRLYGDQIAERSVQEIRAQGFGDWDTLSLWGEQMGRVFPDVDDGSSLIGIYTADGRSLFFLDNQEIGVFDDPEFGRHFFGIWLSEKTSEPGLRQELLGAQ